MALAVRRQVARIVVLAMCLLCTTTAASAAASSPTALLASILAAGRAQHSAHYRATLHSGIFRVTQDADVGVGEGIQRITYCRAGACGHVTVIVSGRGTFGSGGRWSAVNPF